jgi:hypothetical protein
VHCADTLRSAHGQDARLQRADGVRHEAAAVLKQLVRALPRAHLPRRRALKHAPARGVVHRADVRVRGEHVRWEGEARQRRRRHERLARAVRAQLGDVLALDGLSPRRVCALARAQPCREARALLRVLRSGRRARGRALDAAVQRLLQQHGVAFVAVDLHRAPERGDPGWRAIEHLVRRARRNEAIRRHDRGGDADRGRRARRRAWHVAWGLAGAQSVGRPRSFGGVRARWLWCAQGVALRSVCVWLQPRLQRARHGVCSTHCSRAVSAAGLSFASCKWTAQSRGHRCLLHCLWSIAEVAG